MVYTPYPNNDSFYENPCITYSNDGINWSEKNIINPIISVPEDARGSWYSDPHLVYRSDTNVLELWVRYCSRGTDGLENGWEGVYRLTSTDGIHWSEKECLYYTIDSDWTSVLSPSIIYDEGKYKIWFVYKRQCLKYYESADGTNW
jgi:sucrose-6-phosphate hydrolase SacC (GH32 family)